MGHKTCEQTKYKYVQCIFTTLCPARDLRYIGMNSCNEFPNKHFSFSWYVHIYHITMSNLRRMYF